MGKRAKEHRKKVQARNQKIQQERKKFERLYTEMVNNKLNELREKYSGATIEEVSSQEIETVTGTTI